MTRLLTVSTQNCPVWTITKETLPTVSVRLEGGGVPKLPQTGGNGLILGVTQVQTEVKCELC